MTRTSTAAVVALALVAGLAGTAAAERSRRPSLAITITVDAQLIATVTIKNRGKRALTLASHVQAGERHYDWLAIDLRYPVFSDEGCGQWAGNKIRTLRFVDDRDKSARITRRLGPGKQLVQTIDLAAWARRQVNGGQPIGPGHYKVVARYEVTDSADVWRGKTISAPFQLTLPGHIDDRVGEMCADNPGWDRF